MEQYLEDYHKPTSLTSMKIVAKLPTVKKKTAHQTLVDEILAVAGNHTRYNYKFWVSKISRSKLSMNAILDLIETAKKMDSKYNKGGFLSKRI